MKDAFVRPAKCQNESGPSEVCQFEVKGMSMEDILSPKNLEDDAFFAEVISCIIVACMEYGCIIFPLSRSDVRRLRSFSRKQRAEVSF